MSRHTGRFVILLILTSAAATPALQEGVHRHADKASSGPAWPELMASMDKMQVSMASVDSSGNSDVDFVRLMLPHHEAAIDMAKTQLLYGKDPQMRRLAQEIITDQQSEIELMQLWLKQHGSAEKADPMPARDIAKER
jgi:uncharacterized protein (DUF305 family)